MKPVLAIFRALHTDLLRVLAMTLIGMLLVRYSQPFAELLGEPAYAAWGLFCGGMFVVAGLSHTLRRLFFPRLELHTVATHALLGSTGAGCVFIGVCLVLAALVLAFGAMLRV